MTSTAAEIKRHRERLAWLLLPKPKWSCGTPVDAAIKARLIDQSRGILIRHKAPETEPAKP